MIREFYSRHETDPNYAIDIYETNSELEALVYQIRMLLHSNQGEVLGQPDFGTNQMDKLFQTNVNLDSLKAQLLQQINLYCELAKKFKINLRIKRVPDRGYRDMIIIDVIVNGVSAFGFIT